MMETKRLIAIVLFCALVLSAFAGTLVFASTSMGEVIELMPLVDFNDWTYQEVQAGKPYQGNYVDGAAPVGEKFFVVNNPGIINVGVRDEDDKYVISNVRELNYQASDNPAYLNQANALSEGEQLVFSLDVIPKNSLSVDIRMTNDGGPTTMFSITGGKINLYDCVPHVTDVTTGAIVAKYELSPEQWSRVDLVYTRLGTMVNGEKRDCAEVYINGRRAKKMGILFGEDDGYVIPMANSIMDGRVSRFTLHNGVYDNVCAKHYKDGVKFTPTSGRVFEIIPYLDFEDWTDEEVKANNAYAGNYIDKEAPATKSFYVANNNGSIMVPQKEDGDKYLKNNAGELYYRSQDNEYSLGKWINGLDDGVQMVFSLDAHSSISNGGIVYIRNATAGGLTTMFGINNGYLNLYNGEVGTNVVLAKCKLPDNVWTHIDLVYTRGAAEIDENDYDTVAVYIDKMPVHPMAPSGGYTDSPEVVLKSNILDDGVSRFTFSRGAYDNLSVRMYSEGAGYIPGGDTIGSVTTIMPMLDFDGCTEQPANSSEGSVYVSSYDENGDAIENTMLRIAPDDRGTSLGESDGRGMPSDGKYIKTGGNVQYTKANNPVLEKPMIYEGDRMMMTYRIDTGGPSSTMYIRYDGTRYFSKNGEVSSVINFNRVSFFNTNNDTFYLYNGEINGDDNDGVSTEPMASVKLPSDRWVTITIVYTAGDAKITTEGSSSKAEVVNSTRPDRAVLYVNNRQVTAELELAESNMFRSISRFDFQGGYYDDICAKVYSGGAKFEPELVPGSDVVAAEEYDLYGGKFYTDKTVAEFEEMIKVQPFTDGCTIIDADGNQLEESTAASMADCVYIKSKNGLAYTMGIEQKTADAAVVSFDGGSDLQINGTTVAGVGDGYGKEATDKTYAFPSGTENNQIYIGDFSSFGVVPTDVSPMFLTFDIISKKADASGKLSINGTVNIGAGNGISAKSGVNLVEMVAAENGLVYTSVLDGRDDRTPVGAIEVFRTGEWHRVGIQLYPARREYDIYVDGVLCASGEISGAFEGMAQMYLDCNIEGVCIDNIEVLHGVYNQSAEEIPGMSVSDDADIPDGYELCEDILSINKSTLQAQWMSADAFEIGENNLDAGIKFIDGNGAEAEGEEIAKIVLCTNDGRFRYWNIEPRTGHGIYMLNEGKVMYDAEEATDFGDLSQLTMYVATYGKGGYLSGIQSAKAYEVDGRTCFFDGLTMDDLDKVFLWSEAGVRPVCKAELPTVACWGDSLTSGYGADTNYPRELEKICGLNVYNMGAGRENASTIAARSGGLTIRLDYDVIIPADKTEVEIVVSAYNPNTGGYAGVVNPEDVSAGGWSGCTICGIEGRLGVNDNGVLTFIRDKTGVAVVAQAGETVSVSANAIDADVNIFFAGTFGVGDGLDEMPSDSKYLYLARIINAMVNAQRSDRFIVIGLTSGDRNTWRQTNSLLKGNFGENFVDAKGYLSSVQALEDAGITPDLNDYGDIGHGRIPSAFLADDKIHLNDTGYKLLARLVHKKMLELGYCR